MNTPSRLRTKESLAWLGAASMSISLLGCSLENNKEAGLDVQMMCVGGGCQPGNNDLLPLRPPTLKALNTGSPRASE
jgi:hypothetical protein